MGLRLTERGIIPYLLEYAVVQSEGLIVSDCDLLSVFTDKCVLVYYELCMKIYV